MNSQKGIAPVVIILAVVILLGIGAGGFVLVSKNKTSSLPSPIQEEKIPSQTEKPATLPVENQKQTVIEPKTVAEPKIAVCGNGVCEQGENAVSCPEDCSVGLERIVLFESDLPLIQNVAWQHVGGNGFSIDSFLDKSMRGFGLLEGMSRGFETVPSRDYLVHLNQLLLRFPLENIEKVFAATKTSLNAFSSTPLEDLPNPNIGDRSVAFKRSLGDGRTFYYIAFIKKGYYSSLEFSGTGINYNDLEYIAKKAVEKIK